MPTPLRFVAIPLVAAASLMAASLAATVTSPPATIPLNDQGRATFSLKIATSGGQPVAAIQGDLHYSPDLFQPPAVALASGLEGTVTLRTHQAEPGRLRFLIYTNPVTPLNLDAPLVQWTLTARTTNPDAFPTQVSYDLTQAARPTGEGFGTNVRLSPITITSDGGGQVFEGTTIWILR